MSTLAPAALGPHLESLVAELDISPSKYKEAVDRYEAVGRWLEAPESPLRQYGPVIYPQGSFRLGTVVRPVKAGQEADYDIDLVCQLGVPKQNISPASLKNLIGDRLKDHERYREMLDEEGRRCWTLKYAEADGVGFHLDALPAVPEERAELLALEAAGTPERYWKSAIAITERMKEGGYVWVPGGSNPLGFAQWFDEVNGTARARVALSQRQAIFRANRSIYASVDAVPEALVRTPLQRMIQILKRHRDARFSGHEWEPEKPISMIITTLAALAYEGQVDIAFALESFLAKVDDYAISGIIRKEGGKWVIPNPVNRGENFADRWNEPGSHRPEAFFEWIGWLQQDLAHAAEKAFPDDCRRVLAESLGITGEQHSGKQATGSAIMRLDERVPTFANSSHRQAPPWPMQLRYQVDVKGQVRASVDSTKNLWRLTNRAVRKNLGIRFYADTNVPKPFEVMWQVVNTGPEAIAAGRENLRGGFDEGEGTYGTMRTEGTAYRGTHTIEAFVIKDDICVARSGPTYVRIG